MFGWTVGPALGKRHAQDGALGACSSAERWKEAGGRDVTRRAILTVLGRQVGGGEVRGHQCKALPSPLSGETDPLRLAGKPRAPQLSSSAGPAGRDAPGKSLRPAVGRLREAQETVGQLQESPTWPGWVPGPWHSCPASLRPGQGRA